MPLNLIVLKLPQRTTPRDSARYLTTSSERFEVDRPTMTQAGREAFEVNTTTIPSQGTFHVEFGLA